MMRTLAKQQQDFADALLNREQQQKLSDLFMPAPELIERFAMYRGNYNAICLNTLSQAYPVLLQLVGAEYFEQMTQLYARVKPSQSGNLAEFGQELSEFLQSQPDLINYPYLADVARLEWLLHRTYYAKERSVLDLPTLARHAQMQQIDPMALRLGWQDYVELVSSEFAIATIWRSLSDASATDIDMSGCNWRQAENVLICRSNWQSLPTPISKAEYAALCALRQGQTIGSALELALAMEPEFDIGGKLQTWFANELFYSMDENES